NNAGRHSVAELVEQIRITREQIAEPGNVFFSMKSFMNPARGKAEALKAVYTEPALIPAMPWLGKKPAVKLAVEWKPTNGRIELVIKPEGDPVRSIVIRSKVGGAWGVAIHPANGTNAVTIPLAATTERVQISALDRLGQESEPTAIWK